MAERLERLGILTLDDFLHHFPRDYDDRSQFTAIGDVSEEDTVTVLGTVLSSRLIRMRGRANMAVIEIEDESGRIKASWFGRGFLANSFSEGKRVVLSGEVGKYKGLCLKNPEYEVLTGDQDDQLNTGRIVPIYRLTDKVSQRMMRKWVATALDLIDDGQEYRIVHFPESLEDARTARDRFVYQELFALQLRILEEKQARIAAGDGIAHVTDGEVLKRLRAALPFSLTSGQAAAVSEILEDMGHAYPMRRLLQGDVGCGKTLVACHAMAAALDGGYQVACMVPTEVLAEQHFRSLTETFSTLGVHIALLTGNTEGADGVRHGIASGEAQIVVGTHALIQDSVSFQNLGLVVVDEQHRFGVMQRQSLTGKGRKPDVIQMTATPIPRTLAITAYGGCDLSLIDELPPGRLPIKTSYVTPGKVPGMYAYICEQAREGFQSYVVCPLVEESETRDIRNVVDHFEDLSAGPFSELNTAMVHGRMKSEEKDAALKAFVRGDIDVLFSTSVIEVGIDNPNATTIVIEDAGNFGLTQLHQLRGRVGRGSEQSHCFLVGKPKTKEGKRRIEALCATTDGFVIAEEDLKLRGTGEFYGTRQSGESDLRVADLVRDVRILDRARQDAQRDVAKISG